MKNIIIAILAYLLVVIGTDIYNYVTKFQTKVFVENNSKVHTDLLETIKFITKEQVEYGIPIFYKEKLNHKGVITATHEIIQDPQNKEISLSMIVVKKDGKIIDKKQVFDENPRYDLGATISRAFPISLLGNKTQESFENRLTNREYIMLNKEQVFLRTLSKEIRNNFDSLTIQPFIPKEKPFKLHIIQGKENVYVKVEHSDPKREAIFQDSIAVEMKKHLEKNKVLEKKD